MQELGKMTANSKNSKETRISNTAKKAVSKRKRAEGKKTVSRTRTAATSHTVSGTRTAEKSWFISDKSGKRNSAWTLAKRRDDFDCLRPHCCEYGFLSCFVAQV